MSSNYTPHSGLHAHVIMGYKNNMSLQGGCHGRLMAKQSVSWPWKQKVNEHINNMHACNSVNMENTDYRKDNLANLVFN